MVMLFGLNGVVQEPVGDGQPHVVALFRISRLVCISFRSELIKLKPIQYKLRTSHGLTIKYFALTELRLQVINRMYCSFSKFFLQTYQFH